jgi:Flp pilus assembly protein TadB
VRARPDTTPLRGFHALTVAGLAGVALALAVGGPLGPLIGCGAALVLVRWLRGLDSAGLRRRRERMNRDLPWAADLLAVAVGGGAPLDRALRCTAEALGGPLGEELRGVAAALELGAPPALAWAGTDPLLHAVGRSFARAAEHGTPAAQFVGRLADDVRAQARAESAAAVHTAGVRALAPLGLCFLPAFLLLAVLPLVAGVGSTLLR